MARKKNVDRTLELYLKEIGETPLINAEKEVELAKRIKQGDHKALQDLIKANLRFVVSVAKQYQNQGLSLSDLINEGNIGLIKAAKRFDERKGFKFISYAVWWIRQSILQALAEQSRIVRLPLNRVGTLHKISKAYKRLEQELARAPSAKELGEELDLPAEEITKTLKYSNSHLSLDKPFKDESDSNSLKDVLEDSYQPRPDNKSSRQSLKKKIREALDTLSEREAEVLKLYYGLGRSESLTLEEVGQRFGLTRERVRQIKEKALSRLRHASRRHDLHMFVIK